MGGLMPKVERHRKSPPKSTKPATFMYSNMVRIQQIDDIAAHYKILGKIGQGSSGTVYKATTLVNPHLRAIKQISKHHHD
jgi:serine/threonine protein kinase